MNTPTNSNTNWLRLLPSLGLVFLCAGAAQAQISTPANPITWNGNVNTIYTNPNNWNFGRVPNGTDYVLIPGPASTTAGRQPVLDPTAGIGAAGLLTINPTASLTLLAQGELDLFGDLVDNGTFGGLGLLSIRSGAFATHNIGGTGGTISINDVETLTGAAATLNIPVRLTRSLALTSNLTTTAAGTLTLLSTPATSSFVINNGGIISGNATVQRAIDNSVNAGVGYRHYSSPVAATTVNDLATSTFTPNFNLAYNDNSFAPGTVPFPTVYLYDQANVTINNGYNNFDRGWRVPASGSTMLVGRGYTVNLGGSELVDFVGVPNNGPQSVTLFRNAAGTTAAGDAGWQFLGNPYPSPIDWSRTTAARTTAAIDDGMYVFSSTSQYGGFYRAYINSMGNPVIPMAQGFFVRRSAASAGTTTTFTFTNDFRLTSSDGTTFQRQVADVRPQLEMALHSSDKVVQDMLNVYFENGSTAGAESKYDAVKMPNKNGMFLGTLAADGQELAIDGRPMPTDNLTIPLHVAVSASGTYTIETTKLTNMGDLHVYLHDKRLGSFTDLSQQPEYTFNLNSVNPAARFELVFSKQSVSTAAPAALTQQVELYPSPAKGKAFLELPTSLGGEAIATTLIDAMGRTVRTSSLAAEGEATHQVDLEGLRSGVYVLQLHTSAGIVAKRLVVE